MTSANAPLPTITHGYEGATWLQHRLRHFPKTRDVILSPFGEVVADILGYLYHGIYNAGKVKWERWGLQFSHNSVIEVVVPAHGGWSTYDGDMLTRLVLIAAATGIRIEVSPINQYYFRLYFHRRHSCHLPEAQARSHPYATTHPTLTDLEVRLLTGVRITWEPSE